MSELEDLVVEALRADAGVRALVCTVDAGATPAVFVNAAPDDRSTRWSNSTRLPYLVISANRSWTATSPVDGLLQATAVGEGDEPVALQRAVQAVLDGAYWHPTTEPDTATRKAGEDEAPELLDSRGATVRVREATYDLVAFPPPPVYAPDVLAALVAWTATALPGVSVAPPSWTRGTTAIYWRFVAPWFLDRLVQGPVDGGLDQWWSAGARAHVLATEQAARLELASQLAQALARKRRWPEVGMRLDLRETSVMIDPAADPLRDGQVTGRVLFLQREPATPAEVLETIVAEGDLAFQVPAPLAAGGGP